MNKLIIFGAGAIVGAAVGVTITVFAYQKEKKQWREDLENARKGLVMTEKDEEAIETTPQELAEYYIQQLIDLGVDVSREDIEYDEYDDGYICETSRKRTSLVNPVEEEESEEEDEDNDQEDGPIEPNPDPYEISSNEFGQKEFYDTETIIFYQGDHVMTDSNYEFVDGWEKHVGYIEDKLLGMDASKKGQDTLYIRNEVECTDYEVLIYTDSYKHAIEGEDDEPLGDMAD